MRTVALLWFLSAINVAGALWNLLSFAKTPHKAYNLLVAALNIAVAIYVARGAVREMRWVKYFAGRAS